MTLPLRVDTDLPFAEIARAIGAAVSGKEVSVKGVALDTRALQPGDLFFALRAVRDGHEFLKQAFDKGAAAAVVDRPMEVPGTALQVADTSAALSALAHFARMKWGKKVVAISGSNGKTTTKEMTAAVVGAAMPALKAPGTWNNQLGVPLTLLMLRPHHQAAVLEMGMNDYGELSQLGKTAAHDVAVLTNIGPAHFEKFGSLEGVAKAKSELFTSLRPGGTAVINLDDRHIGGWADKFSGPKVTLSMAKGADVEARVKRDLGTGGFVLDVRYGGTSVEIQTPFIGVHNIYNLLCAFGASLALGVPAGKLQAGVNAVERVGMRLETIELPHGIRIVNDCYNANPGSMLVALEVVKNMPGQRAVAVLGDMAELGEYAPRAHRDIGIHVAAHKYAHLFVMGQFAGDIAQGAIQGGMRHGDITTGKTHAETAAAVCEFVKPGDTVLVKGSRVMKLEEVTNRLKEKLGGEKA